MESDCQCGEATTFCKLQLTRLAAVKEKIAFITSEIGRYAAYCKQC